MSLTVDRAYTNLLTHLQRPASVLPLETIISVVPHYLAQLPLPHPTQLTAFVVSSPLWHPLSIDSIRSLITLYRSAVHLKERNLQKQAGGWFARSVPALIAEWASAVMKGVSRGHPQLRIAIFGGLLLGFSDLGLSGAVNLPRERVERETIVACAEMLEATSTRENLWKNEFTTREISRRGREQDLVFLYSLYSILPYISNDKIIALDIQALAALAEKGIEIAFSSGEFLSSLSESTVRNATGQIIISSNSKQAISLRAMNERKVYEDISLLAKLLAQCLSLLADEKPTSVWSLFQNVSDRLESTTSKIEKDWNESPLAAIIGEQNIEPETRTLTTEIWKALKTLLFTHLLISQAILSAILHIAPASIPANSISNPFSIASSTLRSLNHMSFVISKFGGITSSSDGFKELKEAFYLALDIIVATTNVPVSSKFVRQLLSQVQESHLDSAHPFRQSQTAYVLAVVEQLMPVLSDSVIEHSVIPLCQPHLNDPKDRETYESAHSVMLSIFASDAQRKDKCHVAATSSLAERLVPFYVNSLIENSDENRLNTDQLRLAYSSLVRSAASSSDDAITWLCIDAVLVQINSVASELTVPMRLYLVLVSLISCTPLSLLPRLLNEVQKIFQSVRPEEREELGNAIVEELTHRVGDRETETVLSWWCSIVPSSTRVQL